MKIISSVYVEFCRLTWRTALRAALIVLKFFKIICKSRIRYDEILWSYCSIFQEIDASWFVCKTNNKGGSPWDALL